MQLIRSFREAPAATRAAFAGMVTLAGLAQVREYAEAIGPDQNLVIDPNAAAIFLALTTLVLDAHAAGLAVHSRTARAGEQLSSPKLLQHGDPTSPDFPGRAAADVDKLLVALFAGGCDGVATTVPDRAGRAGKDRRRSRS